MPESVQVAVVTGIFGAVAVILSGLGVLLKLILETRRHAQRADSQVSNDHTTNLREESDTRHDENTATLAEIKRGLDTVRGEIRGIRRDVGRLWEQDQLLARQMYDMEATSDREAIEHARELHQQALRDGRAEP